MTEREYSMGFRLRLFSWKSFYGHSPERNLWKEEKLKLERD
jgi:hypothetical protein